MPGPYIHMSSAKHAAVALARRGYLPPGSDRINPAWTGKGVQQLAGLMSAKPNFTALGARPEYAWLEAVSGTVQVLPASGIPDLVTLRVRDMNGNPMAAGSVTLYQSLYTWTPPCAPHGRCAQAPLLATQTSTATSALDGTVTFAPASISSVPTSLVARAATGNSSTLTITVEEHP